VSHRSATIVGNCRIVECHIATPPKFAVAVSLGGAVKITIEVITNIGVNVTKDVTMTNFYRTFVRCPFHLRLMTILSHILTSYCTTIMRYSALTSCVMSSYSVAILTFCFLSSYGIVVLRLVVLPFCLTSVRRHSFPSTHHIFQSVCCVKVL
jgi:hypothetical protein